MGQGGTSAQEQRLSSAGPRRSGRDCHGQRGGKSRAREVRILHFGGGRAESLAPGAWPPPGALLPTPWRCRGHPPPLPRGAGQRRLKWTPLCASRWFELVQAPCSSFRQNGGRHHCYHHHHHHQLLQEPCQSLTWRPPPQRVGAGGRLREMAAGRRCLAGQAVGEAPSRGYVRSPSSLVGALPLSTLYPSWEWPQVQSPAGRRREIAAPGGPRRSPASPIARRRASERQR